MPDGFFWRDRTDTRRDREAFAKVRRAAAQYSRQLRKVARQVAAIVDAFDPLSPQAIAAMTQVLRQYAETIRPWANAVGARMLADVKRRDDAAWTSYTRGMSRALREEIAQAPTGEALRALMGEQVRLITSLPTEAAERVHNLVLKGMTTGTRASEVAREIMRTGEVTQSRANLIARTETTRAASALTQVRAQHVGSTAYVWRTAEDSDVRPSHRKMNGKVVMWADAPVLDGMQGHAGALPNCRCYAEPIIPEA